MTGGTMALVAGGGLVVAVVGYRWLAARQAARLAGQLPTAPAGSGSQYTPQEIAAAVATNQPTSLGFGLADLYGEPAGPPVEPTPIYGGGSLSGPAVSAPRPPPTFRLPSQTAPQPVPMALW